MTARMAAVGQPTARGMIFIHSAPAALCPHLEWAAGMVLGGGVDFEWSDQPAEPRSRRAEMAWSGDAGIGAALASKLASFERVRFEITEDATPGSDGQRFCFTPTLGPFSAIVGVHGDILIHEDRIRSVMVGETTGENPIHMALEHLLGTPWDEELDTFRHASEDSPVRWLHQVV